MSKVIVYFETRTEWTAEVDYDELAQAWREDAKEFGEDARSPLPPLAQIRAARFSTVKINEFMDGEVDQMLQDNGIEVDGSLAYVTEIAVPRGKGKANGNRP